MVQGAPVSPAGARLDRVPPHSEDAERGALGSILLDGEKVLDFCIERQLTPDSFYVPAHRTVYETMLAMSREGRPIDLLTVTERLQSAGILDRVGGPTALDRLVDATPTAAHAEYYIGIVRDKYLLRRVIETARDAERRCYEAADEATTVLSNVEQAFFDITSSQHGIMRPWEDLIREMVGLLDNSHRGMQGVMTGYADIDHYLQGLKPSNMVVLAARPSVGKTSLAMNIVEHVAVGGRGAAAEPRPVGVFSLEMSCLDLIKRMMCCRAEVSAHAISGGFISQVNHGKLMSAADALVKAPIFLDDTAGLDITELRARARRMKAKHNVELIVIDYLQLLRAPEYSRHGRQVEIAMVSGNIKAMAKELQVPVLVLSQLSRAPEARDDERPKLSDLRDSGSIEQDADVVLMLRRSRRGGGGGGGSGAGAEAAEPDDDRIAILDIAKNRNGPAGLEIRLVFEKEYTRFHDAARGVDDQAG